MIVKIAKIVKQYVKEECEKPGSGYGPELFEYHLIPVVAISKRLARKLKAEIELIELAAWLHDIGSIIKGRKDHHKTGARIAEKKLLELNYPKDKIKLIKKCVINHRGSVNNNRESIEEKIISDTDAIVCFDTVPGLFKAAYIFEDLTQGEARVSVRKKLERKYKQLYFKESRDMVRKKYKAMKELLS